MNQSPLPLADLRSAPSPFTPSMARTTGMQRSALDRQVRSGAVRRILRGVYVDASVPETGRLRAAALALVMPADAVAVDRTAAWLHGAEVASGVEGRPPPLDLVRTSGNSRRHFGGRRALSARDVVRVGDVRVTTPLRTALDLGRLLAPDRALATVDVLLRTGAFSHVELLAELSRMGGHKGVVQLRRLAPLADARAADPAESVLRLRWLAADLPTPVPHLLVAAPGGRVEVTLGAPGQRFAVCLGGRAEAERIGVLTLQGWRVVVVSARRVLHADAYLVSQHLRTEFHRQLLGQV
ncbi:MAG: hypothetical protein M3Z50_10060, partial [Actinomycetota bacterium]|nr:hypothetical protein [Actinomycetota bacterium]